MSTLEVLLKPLSGCRSTHLLTGFVHRAYPPIYAMLAQQSGFDSAMIVRGTEGGCIPALNQLSRYFSCWNRQDQNNQVDNQADNQARGDETLTLHRLAPRELGIEQDVRAVAIPKQFATAIEETGFQHTDKLNAVVAHHLKLGLAALANNAGPMRDSLIYGAAIGLGHVGLATNLADGANRARAAIANGDALTRFEAG